MCAASAKQICKLISAFPDCSRLNKSNKDEKSKKTDNIGRTDWQFTFEPSQEEKPSRGPLPFDKKLRRRAAINQ